MARGRGKGRLRGQRHFSSPEEIPFADIFFIMSQMNLVGSCPINSIARKNLTKYVLISVAGTSAHQDFKQEEEAESNEQDKSDKEAEEKTEKRKGIRGIIEIENPNLAKPKILLKAGQVDLDETVHLSRRERMELQKHEAHERLMRLKEQGKTEQARKDLERLSMIRKQRAEAALKRKEEKAGLLLSP
ncbi:hypothetical protein ACLOJK_009741 [Asimina triloba]